MTGLPLRRTASGAAQLRPERARDRAAIESLLDLCFGDARANKTVYRLRENVEPVPELSYVVDYKSAPEDAGADIAATIRYWPVLLPDTSASLLLGPIAVDPARQQEGIGGELMIFTLAQAKTLGYANVVLVGDAPYYTRFGFRREVMLGLDLPGPVEAARLLGLEWVVGSLAAQKGVLRKWPSTRLLPHYQPRDIPKKPQR